jgi:AmmeMemoRadiSam system protein B/AmmeMemoRadiSam system protein A
MFLKEGDAVKHSVSLALSTVCLLAGSALAQGVREPAWAGQFYDADASRLAAAIDGFLKDLPAAPDIRGDIRAIVVPHAGYVYSGRTAAYAYRLVKGKPYDTVVIIGPSHRYGFKGGSIYPKGGFRTPLGTAVVDEALAAELMKRSGFKFIPEAHEEEHSVEVQVPFVQQVLPGAKIVPVVMGYPEMRTVKALSAALDAACAGRKVLVVASTDMSHFLSKDKANAADSRTIELIKALKADEIEGKTEAGENILCGGAPVAAVLLYVQKAGPVRAEVLNYADSAAATGDGSRVVGYVSAALVAEGGAREPAFELSDAEKKELLGLARSAVEAYVEDGRVIEYASTNSRFLSHLGVFVTLKKWSALRGCIGFIEPVMPLVRGVVEAAIYAAARDVRFEPVSKAELRSLQYEISVLTPLADVPDPNLVKVGKHGLVIEMNGRKGLLLPQVPVEYGWDRRTFLEQVCLKAGLPPDAWKKGAKLKSFEAIVFHE